MKYIKIIKERWKAETPLFFKKMRSFAVKLGSASISLLLLNNFLDLTIYGIPEIVFKIAVYIIIICMTLGLTSQITQSTDFTNQEKIGKILKK